MMKGFSERLQRSLPSYLEQNDQSNVTIVSDNLRDLSTWIGASMIASMSTFNKLLITRESFADKGEDNLGILKKIF